MRLFRLVYFSENHLDHRKDMLDLQLQIILKTSRAYNSRDKITGALALDDLWFMQVLEGDRDAVWITFDRIRQDERHRDVKVVNAQDVAERHFGRWSMAFAVRDASTAPIMDKYSDRGRTRPPAMAFDDMLNLLIETAAVSYSAQIA